MTIGIRTTRRSLAIAGLALGLGMTAAMSGAVAMGTAGADTVRSFYDTLLTTMRSGPSLGAPGREM